MDVRGPYFEELRTGQVFADVPPVTLTTGLAAAHAAIVGCRLGPSLSEPLAVSLAGRPLADPALVWNLAIGHSSVVTQNVRANLYYRGLRFHRLAAVGDTLRTTTTIDALRQNRPRPGRPATGLALLRIVTVDQDGRTVLDFRRCAMIPLLDGSADTGRHDELPGGAADLDDEHVAVGIADWTVPASGTAFRSGETLSIDGADVVSAAPELARLTLNVAAVHHDAVAAGGQRLVFGGHTIALALTQVTRAIPGLLTVLGWHSCDHLAPVHEGDRLASTVEIERATAAPVGGTILHLRSRVRSLAEDGTPTDVLDWRFVALVG